VPDNPTALQPALQPTVNQLTDACRTIAPNMTARNLHTQALALSQNVAQLFALTGNPHLAKYMDAS
jgi:hypothetical protein